MVSVVAWRRRRDRVGAGRGKPRPYDAFGSIAVNEEFAVTSYREDSLVDQAQPVQWE